MGVHAVVQAAVHAKPYTRPLLGALLTMPVCCPPCLALPALRQTPVNTRPRAATSPMSISIAVRGGRRWLPVPDRFCLLIGE